MDRLREIEVFVAVIDAGSLAKAGERLHMSPPSVTRAVSSLEERLGTKLLNRTTRSLSLTEAGARYAASCRRLLNDFAEAENSAVGETAAPQGHLSLTASVTFGRIALAPILSGFLNEFPKITASLTLLDRIVNLVEEGLDAGVRIAALPDSSLVARRIGAVRRVLVASPAYLARTGIPETPSELRHHQIIGFTGLTANREWRFDVNDKPVQVSLKPRFEVNDASTAIAAALAGDGITTGFCYMMGEHIRSGRLVPVLKPFWPAPVPVQLVYPQSRLLAAKVRAFVDWTAPHLASALKQLSGP